MIFRIRRLVPSLSKLTLPYRALWGACFLGYAAIGMTIPVIPAYVQDRFDGGSVMSGIAVTIGALATMLSRPIAGRLVDRQGARTIVMTGSALGLAGGLAHLVANNLPLLILARLALGAGEGALFTASIGWVLAASKPSRRGRIAGHFGMSMWVGLAIGPVLGTAILAVGSYSDVWIAASLCPALAWLLVARSPGRDSISPKVQDTSRALIPRASWRLGASNIGAGIGYGVIVAFLVTRFRVQDAAGANLALSVFGIAFLITRLVGSAWVDRFGARRVILAVFLAEAIGLCGLSQALSPTSLLGFTALTGAALSMLYPCLASLVTEAAPPHQRTTALGAVTSAWDLGVTIGGPLGGLVAGASISGPFAIGAVAALCATLPILLSQGSRRIPA